MATATRADVWRTALVFGGVAFSLMAVLKLGELAPMRGETDLPTAAYVAVPSLAFLAFGIWLGTRKQKEVKEVVVVKEVRVAMPMGAMIDAASPEVALETAQRLGISQRELEVLAAAARGASNQEIADELFISLSTVKTHLGNLFVKLDVKRRTQAISRAQELGLVA